MHTLHSLHGQPENQCPQCMEDRQTEFDPVLLVYVCTVCSTTWRRRRGVRVPPVKEQPTLPGHSVLTLDTELGD